MIVSFDISKDYKEANQELSNQRTCFCDVTEKGSRDLFSKSK